MIPIATKTGARITTSDTARLLGCSRQTVMRLIEEGELQAWRHTQRGWHLVEYDSVMDYLTRNRPEKNRPE